MKKFLIIGALALAACQPETKAPARAPIDQLATAPACKDDWTQCASNYDLIEYSGLYKTVAAACERRAREQDYLGYWVDFRFPQPSFAWYLISGDMDYVKRGRWNAVEHNAQFKNQYGAWKARSVSCVYDLRTNIATEAFVAPADVIDRDGVIRTYTDSGTVIGTVTIESDGTRVWRGTGGGIQRDRKKKDN